MTSMALWGQAPACLSEPLFCPCPPHALCFCYGFLEGAQTLFCLSAFALPLLPLGTRFPAPPLVSSISPVIFNITSSERSFQTSSLSQFPRMTLFTFFLAFLVTICNELRTYDLAPLLTGKSPWGRCLLSGITVSSGPTTVLNKY